MERYKNLNGSSGIKGYEFLEDSITIYFATGSIYIYNYHSAGKANIDKMKLLATSGSGLNSFINIYVKTKYARKIK